MRVFLILKYKIYRFSNYTVEVINNPINILSPSWQDKLVEECIALSRDSFGNSNIKREFVKHCVLNSSILVLGRDYDDRLFGYSSNSVKLIEGYIIIYLQSIAILERFQGMGLRHILSSIKMIEDVYKIKTLGIDSNRILIAARTQNPLVFKFAARYLGLFPQPDGAIDSTIRDISDKFVKCLYDVHNVEQGQKVLFDNQYFVERGAYKSVTQTSIHGVYPSGIPYCRDDDEINQYMNQHLDWQNGDALVMLGHYKEEIMNKMFEDAKQRMGFGGVEEVELERELANSYH